MTLPNQLVGSVAITEVSDALTKRVEAAAADEDDDEDMDAEKDLPELKDIFHIGQWVQCAVISVQEAGVGKKRIELSLKPTAVNGAIAKVDVDTGMVSLSFSRHHR